MNALSVKKEAKWEAVLLTSRHVDGEFLSLVLPMIEIDGDLHIPFSRMSSR